MRQPEAAQTLVIFALFIPLVLLPIVGYAIEASLLATRAGALQAAVAQAAEDGAQAIDSTDFRSNGVLVLDAASARRIAATSVVELDRFARIDGVEVTGRAVTVKAHEEVPLEFGGILAAGSIKLAAVATARLAVGYRSPSSRLPLPNRSLSRTG